MLRSWLIMDELCGKECVNHEFINYCGYFTGFKCTSPKEQYELCKSAYDENRIRPLANMKEYTV